MSADFANPAIVPESVEVSDETPSETIENGHEPTEKGDENKEQSQEEGRFVLEDDDDSSDDEELVVTIGDIKKNIPFQKQAGPVGKVDMDGEPDMDGKVIYDLDLAQMEEKPWQKPGADLTDYFNYGFTEDTWNQYCERQRKLRSEYGNQKDANRSIMNSISLNANLSSHLGVGGNSSLSSGRHLVNLAGPDKPQKANKMLFDLNRHRDNDNPLRSNLTQHLNTATHIIRSEPESLVTNPGDAITNPGFSKTGNSQDGYNVPPGIDGPPGVDGPPGEDVPSFDISVPPPNFNPNVPPPGLGANVLTMPPPLFNQVPVHVSAGFGQGQAGQFNNRPQPLMGRGFGNGGYDEERGNRYRRERTDREETEEERERRRRRRHSRSPRREERDRGDRDRSEKSSRSSKRSERDRERKRSRDREGSYERDKKRSRKHERERSKERSSSRRHESSRNREVSPDAPPGIDPE